MNTLSTFFKPEKRGVTQNLYPKLYKLISGIYSNTYILYIYIYIYTNFGYTNISSHICYCKPYNMSWYRHGFIIDTSKWFLVILWMEEILHQLKTVVYPIVFRVSTFNHPKWCRIPPTVCHCLSW